jgi:hypothetical protein
MALILAPCWSSSVVAVESISRLGGARRRLPDDQPSKIKFKIRSYACAGLRGADLAH